MLDIFVKEDMQKLLENKSVVLLGDSNVRALYKDFLCLLRNTQFIPERILKQKMENSCYGDKLVYHGERSNGREYREERAAKINSTLLSFFFLTRVYNNYVKEVLKIITKKGPPDILIINCCLWDVTRWGPSGVEQYKINLKDLMKELKNIMPDCLVIWVTTPPIASEVKGGFLLKELQFLKYSLRFHVVEANHYARKIVIENGFDVLDSHYHLKMQIHRRTEDGVHWKSAAVRYITNLLLTHISLAWNKSLPHRYKSEIMEQNLEAVMQQDESNIEISKTEETKDTTHEAKSEVSSTAQDTSQKNGKENSKTPKRKRKKRNAYSPHCWGVSPAHVRNTHHAFLSRVQNKQRRKHIRQWQQPAAANSPHSLSPIMSPADRYEFHNIQHDSGYFSSPGQFQVSFSDVSVNHDFTCYPSQSPLLPNPYTRQRPRSGLNMMEPYIFPHMQQNHSLQPPLIDFTSNDIPNSFSYF